MPVVTTKQLLELAKRVARKTRQLVPRSSNRSGVDSLDRHESNEYVDSWWQDETENDYIKIQGLAMRAGSDVNDIRRKIIKANKNLRYVGLGVDSRSAEWKSGKWAGKKVTPGRTILNKEFFKAMGWNQANYWNEKEYQRLLESYYRKNGKLNKAKDAWAIKPKSKHKRKFFQFKPDVYTPKERVENTAKNAVMYKIGNCGECASLASMMLCEYQGPGNDKSLPPLPENDSDKPRILKCALVGSGDHAFVLILPATVNDSSLNSKLWLTSPNIVVCDPWWEHLGTAYTCKELAERSNETHSWYDYLKSYLDKTDRKYFQIQGRYLLGEGHTKRWKKKHKNLDYLNMENGAIWKEIWGAGGGKQPLTSPPAPSRSGGMTNPTIKHWQSTGNLKPKVPPKSYK